MSTNDESDVAEALNVIIPCLFAEYESNYNLEYRYARMDRVRQVCAKKFEKYGISELFDSADITGGSISFPDNYDEKLLISTMMLAMFITVYDDYLDSDFGSTIESHTDHKADHQCLQRAKASKCVIIKFLARSMLRVIKSKLSLYQWYVLAKVALNFYKEYYSRSILHRNLTFDSYTKYVKHRRNDVAGGMLAEGLRNCFGISLDRIASNHKLIRRLDELYIDINWQLNDLYSFKKERFSGEHEMNAITVLKRENNVSWQTAVNMLADITVNTYQQLINCIDLVKESELNIASNYLEFLKESIDLYDAFMKYSKRYLMKNIALKMNK